MKKTTLVIMAAGLGSRFGGVKQLEPVGPGGEIILDYSVYDAIRAGFQKIVFIIRKEIEADFKAVIGNRLEEKIEVEYVLQDIDRLPKGFVKPEGRTKPWGTGQAVLSCHGIVKEPFAVINADDYYGREGFRLVNDFLQNPTPCDKKYHFCMAGFELGNTLSEHGAVTRGVCKVSGDNVLEWIEETSDIVRQKEVAATPEKTIPLNQPVSMNMWGFTPDFLDILEERFVHFLGNIQGNERKAEFLLPTLVDELIQSGQARVDVLRTPDRWFGVTYREDKPYVEKSFQRLVEQGIYPKRLY
jgi:UTP-glucose-1-phosphate uridylyltransferase